MKIYSYLFVIAVLLSPMAYGAEHQDCGPANGGHYQKRVYRVMRIGDDRQSLVAAIEDGFKPIDYLPWQDRQDAVQKQKNGEGVDIAYRFTQNGDNGCFHVHFDGQNLVFSSAVQAHDSGSLSGSLSASVVGTSDQYFDRTRQAILHAIDQAGGNYLLSSVEGRKNPASAEDNPSFALD